MMISNIRKFLVQFRTDKLPADSIRLFRFNILHFILIIITGLALVVPSASILLESAVPLNWQQIQGNVSETILDESNSDTERYLVTVFYRIDGETYLIRETFVGDRPYINDPVTVYYNPDNIEEGMVQTASPFTIFAWIPLLGGIAVIITALVLEYSELRRARLRNRMIDSGNAIETVISQVDISTDIRLIRKLFYPGYIFFKISTLSDISEKKFVSDLYIWKSKHADDVYSLASEKVQTIVYLGDGDQYYVKPPYVAPELLADAPEVSLNPVDESTEKTPAVIITRISEGEELDVPSSVKAKQVTKSDLSEVSPTLSVQPSTSQVDDLNIEDVNALDNMLSSIGTANTSPAAIDLSFKDDPENINNFGQSIPSSRVENISTLKPVSMYTGYAGEVSNSISPSTTPVISSQTTPVAYAEVKQAAQEAYVNQTSELDSSAVDLLAPVLGEVNVSSVPIQTPSPLPNGGNSVAIESSAVNASSTRRIISPRRYL